MNHKLYINIIWLCLTISISIDAQQTNEDAVNFNNIRERIFIHSDKELYITGETIWFKIYATQSPDNILSDYSKVANLELIGAKGIVITRVKSKLKNGQGAGSIEIPATLANGNYVLRAYTQHMRNEGPGVFCKNELIILNPESPVVLSSDDGLSEKYDHHEYGRSGVIPLNENLALDIISSKSEYAQRELANVEIITRNQSGEGVASTVSISVSLKNPLSEIGTAATQKGTIENVNDNRELTIKNVYRAEHDGLHMSGKLINKLSDQGAPGIQVLLAYPGKTSQVYATITDSVGFFSFILPTMYGLRPFVIQTKPDPDVTYNIVLDDDFHEIADTTSEFFRLPPHLLTLANASMINAQLISSYESFQPTPEYVSDHQFAGIPFFGTPENQYFLDAYTRFPLAEFFFEIIPEVRVKGKYKEERLKVLNEWEGSEDQSEPLLLVDGVPVFDQRTFLKINNKLIKSTEIVTEPFWLNPGVYDGIIQISSFDGDARSFDLPESALRGTFLSFLPARVFSIPDYSTKMNDQLPDFRNTLYWNPSVQTDKDGKASVSFYTSDAIGAYEIRIQGVGENGLQGSFSETIKVEKNLK